MLGDWVSVQMRRDILARYIPREARVLEANAGVGHFTETLARLGCRLRVLDADANNLDTNRNRLLTHGLVDRVEDWQRGDIAELAGVESGSYDVVVAYDGALSYAVGRREEALCECFRVLRPRGIVVLDVLSLWGTLRRQLSVVLQRDIVENRAVIRRGDAAGMGRACHLFRAAELEGFLRRGGFDVVALTASSMLSTVINVVEEPADDAARRALLEFERAACQERGCLDGGSRLIAVARRP